MIFRVDANGRGPSPFAAASYYSDHGPTSSLPTTTTRGSHRQTERDPRYHHTNWKTGVVLCSDVWYTFSCVRLGVVSGDV